MTPQDRLSAIILREKKAKAEYKGDSRIEWIQLVEAKETFAAHAPDDVSWLLSEIERLQNLLSCISNCPGQKCDGCKRTAESALLPVSPQEE